MTDPATMPEVAIVPANQASWEDLQAVFGTRGAPGPGASASGSRSRGKQKFLVDELRVGSRSSFVDAGFAEVSHASFRRVVMRIDF
jgi:hypothetical protein